MRAVAPLLGIALLLSGCAAAAGPEQTSAGPTGTGSDTAAETTPADPALGEACATFWGDPDYTDPLSREVLDRAASAPDVGPSDPFFYAMTGDDIDAAFESAPAAAQDSAGVLAEWFRTEPELGAEADEEAFHSAWAGVAGSCQEVSAAASWSVAPGESGAKPASLVCADVFDTPGALTHFANGNVLTSNMFKLVGLSPREVPGDRMDDVQSTSELLIAEIDAVDDEAVRHALELVRAPFQDALDGDTWSEGLQGPLDELGTACGAAGYSTPELGETENDAVVGASAVREDGTNHGEHT